MLCSLCGNITNFVLSIPIDNSTYNRPDDDEDILIIFARFAIDAR